jgi:WhiB family redox-sensing transcriptional regulator
MNRDAVNPDDVLQHVAADLDAVESVPDDVLHQVVTRDGSCMALYRRDQQPQWSGEELTDRQTAARICGGCPVQRECLELELRTSGATTLGVWGALPTDEVRALHPVWQARRRQRAGSAERDGAAGGERA